MSDIIDLPAKKYPNGTRPVGYTKQPHWKKQGRPYLYSEEDREDIIGKIYELQEAGYSFTAACADVKIVPATVRKWAKEDAYHAETLEIANGMRQKHFESKVISGQAGAGEIFSLKTMPSGDFRERIEHTGANGGAIAFEHADTLAALTPDERAKLRELIAMRQAEAVMPTIEHDTTGHHVKD